MVLTLEQTFNANKAKPRAAKLYTAEDLLNHPEWGPCELIRGKVKPVCRPNYEHGRLMHEVSHRMALFNDVAKLGSIVVGDSGVILERDPDTVRGPNVYFIRKASEPTGEARKGYLETPPDLCVEIVSPKDRWSKLQAKVAMYLGMGVRIIWVIDPQARNAHVYRLNKEVSMLGPEGVLPGFELPLNDLFALVV